MMDKIKENLATIVVLAIFGPAVGWFLGTSQTAAMARDIAEIKAVLTEIKTSEKKHEGFASCAEMRLFALENGVKRVPPCEGKE